jgi:hypothetical protein
MSDRNNIILNSTLYLQLTCYKEWSPVDNVQAQQRFKKNDRSK